MKSNCELNDVNNIFSLGFYDNVLMCLCVCELKEKLFITAHILVKYFMCKKRLCERGNYDDKIRDT